ncbi:MAG: DUF962 domain-containing protein [Telmatospirillum sp.]|nr:DUF962 domain-containing protein [Telmatospirillum sp.]
MSRTSTDPVSPSPASDAPSGFDAFWPVYLAAHARPWTRRIHVTGTVLAALLLVRAAFGEPWLALLAPVAGYGLAWTAHGLIEGNRPATFGHPLWSFLGDLRMSALFLSGRLGHHLRRHHIGES